MKRVVWGFSCFIFLMTLMGCASKEDREFVEESEGDMVESFDLASKKLSKFRSSELQVEQEKKKIKEEPEKKEVAKDVSQKKAPEKKKEKTEKKDETKEEAQKEPDKVAKADKEKKEEEGESEYPEKYPEYDQRSEKVWDKFVPNSYTNEKFVLEISYLGLTAGNVMLKTEPKKEVSGKEVFHFRAHLKSAQYYSYIYTLDDRVESFVGAEDFLPVKYSLTQRESGQKVDDLQLFDQEELKTYFFYKRIKDGKTLEKEKEAPIPFYVQDSFSVLYFVRGLPLNVGDEYEFPIMTRAKLHLINLKVEKIEEIKIRGKWVDAIRINAITRYPGVLKKKGDIVFWYSADDRRRLLQFEAKVKIGSIKGELIDYKAGTKAQ